MTILGLYLLNHIRTGGNRKYLELLEGLAAKDNRVLVLFNDFPDYIPSYFKKIEVPLRYGGKFPPASYLFTQFVKQNIKQLEKKIKSSGGDVDFIINFGDTQLNAALYLKQELKTKLLYGVRCSDIDRAYILRLYGHMSIKKRVFSLLYEQIERHREKKIARYADCITFLNNFDKESFQRRTHCRESKISVIHNHIGPPVCTDDFKNKNNSSFLKNIVYAGVMSADKGLFDLLQAAAILRDQGYNLHYYLLGRLENTGIVYKLISRLDLKNLISFEGYQNPLPYFVKCDLFVYPTLYDAFGNVVTEALHTGCPVIASDVGGVTEILHYPELLFTLGKPEEIAKKIEACIRNPDHYQKIRSLCRKRAENFYFDWIGLYESILKNSIKGQTA
jgi:glycosyltransferase involved in cell wall biosynthesis